MVKLSENSFGEILVYYNNKYIGEYNFQRVVDYRKTRFHYVMDFWGLKDVIVLANPKQMVGLESTLGKEKYSTFLQELRLRNIIILYLDRNNSVVEVK